MLKAIPILLLTTAPATAACHRYSTWHYPYPQHCAVDLRSTAQASDRAWYVEIIPKPNLIVDELNKELKNPPAPSPGTTYYKQPWIAQCLKSGPPDLCEVAWEKLAASCTTDPSSNLICDAPIQEPKQ